MQPQLLRLPVHLLKDVNFSYPSGLGKKLRNSLPFVEDMKNLAKTC